MSYEYSEDNLVEKATQDVLEELGWQVQYAWTKESFGEQGLLGREHKGEVVLRRYVLQALRQLNPGVPETAYQQAIDALQMAMADRTLEKNNQEKYHQVKNGVEVSYNNEKGETETKRLRVINFDEPTQNHFLAVRQLEIVGELYNRRPDVICFVNGLPLVFMELKAHHTDLRNAYTDNINDYKKSIPHVFHHNAFIILTNGTDAKVGTITSSYKYFLDWKRITENEEGEVSLDTMLRGTCSKENLIDIFENFLLFDDSGGDIVKIMAKNHQFIGVNKVLNQVSHIDELQGKLGVFWHTQGSGKSYSMVFICQKILRKLGGAYTFLIVVDRSELERQIYDTFTAVGAVPVSKNKDNVAKSRDDLRRLLQDNQRYVFTLIHKFSVNPAEESEYPLITERKNIIVISDEAHRTQQGTFARNMRFNAIPNASYLGFTGTPIIKEEEQVTKNIFGEYVSVYDFKRSIEDGATLPLRYLNRGEKLGLINPDINEEMAKVLEREDLDDDQKKKLSYLFSKDYVILTAEKRLEAIAKDLVWHFNERGYQGKAMLVALDKPTAVRMYNLIMKHWAIYTADLEKSIQQLSDLEEVQLMKRKLQKVKETEVCVVVSSEQNEIDKFQKLGLEIAPHRKKMVDRDLETEFKDENHPFRLAIVCAMWITGFDAPCVSTVYLDKPITGHTLMQTIARANRVYDDEKENGLIVDYGNVHAQLEKAYSVYGEGGKDGGKGEDGGNKHKPTELLIALAGELELCINACISYLDELGYNLDDLTASDLKPMQKLGQIKKAVDCICLNEATRAKYEVLARDMFRKYKALYPEEQVKHFIKRFNAIEAIYQQLNQQTKDADITEVMLELQQIVNDSVVIDENEHALDDKNEVYVDLAHLDFEKLKAAFARTSKKNTLVFDLQRAVDKKLKRMLQDNPMRMEFYERYQEIIEEYNRGKSLEDTMRSFDKLNQFINELNHEDARAMRENLTDESLAIFDLLRSGKELTGEELKDVKKIAAGTLNDLKQEKLKIDRWRESRQVQAQVKTMIFNAFQWLPQRVYTDDDVAAKTMAVYQHIYTNYPGVGL